MFWLGFLFAIVLIIYFGFGFFFYVLTVARQSITWILIWPLMLIWTPIRVWLYQRKQKQRGVEESGISLARLGTEKTRV
jgi:hypothetical protein